MKRVESLRLEQGAELTVTKVWESVKKAIDLRDCFVFGGLILLGYGLYLFRPWVSFAVCGAVLLAIGIFIGRGK